MFQLEHYLSLAGVQSDAEKIDVGVTCLSEKALLWWRTVAPTFATGKSFQDFLDDLEAEFQDPDHDLRVRRKLHNLRQTASV